MRVRIKVTIADRDRVKAWVKARDRLVLPLPLTRAPVGSIPVLSRDPDSGPPHALEAWP